MAENENEPIENERENMDKTEIAPSSLAGIAAGHQPKTPGSNVMGVGLEARGVHAWFGEKHALSNVSLDFWPGTVTALIGPSGCGKSTFIRTLNRMHEFIPTAAMAGEVLLNGEDIYAPGVDVTKIRLKVGMVFQKPNPFPSMTIAENVLAGLKLALCIARSLAVRPQVLLMDEPCSALDPGSTLKIEETISHLSSSVTIIIVTHNMQQAARVSDYTAFFLSAGGPGQMVEVGPTNEIFSRPKDKRTEDYVTGRFG